VSAAFSPEWVASQRWFRSKQRPIATVAELDRAPIAGTAASLVVLAVAYVDGGENDRYLVPAVGHREPEDGEGAWRALVSAMAENAVLEGRRGRFRCASTDALARLVDRHDVPSLAERRLRVEQSNTSVVLGDDRLILKLYRLLEPGLNPDVEVSAFLTDAGFSGTPAVAGTLRYESPGASEAAAGMLQEFVPSSGDAWAAMLAALRIDPDRGISLAGEVGAVTAGMHAALASRPDHPEFPARNAVHEELAAWRASAEGQLGDAVSAVRGEAHSRLVDRAAAIRARFADAFASVSHAAVTRIHGDYHLGQLLARHDDGLSVIDFEGEPARPLAERRRPSSPLRDVAGMLRSLDYAARTAAAEPEVGDLDPDRWLGDARASFLAGYGGIRPEDQPLLGAFELEKACYEVRYEASNRPDWLWLPLAAIDRLAARMT
jgi:trehalose synthase-fused probable maltokinase